MAKLIIFRGEAKLDERELKEQTVRIGRGAQNDLILEDPGKGVSRNHAEIRFEGGRYTLVDLQSQNGIWVSGTRVSSVVLEPGVSAALGPFRLMVPAPPPSTVVAATPSSGIYPATEMTQMSERSAAPLQLDSLAPAPEKKSPPKPVVEKTFPPVAKPAAKKTPPGPAPSTSSRLLVGAVAAVLLIAVSAYVGYKLMHKTPPAWDAAVAQQLIDSGKCPEAMDTQITPALRENPTNELALKLRERCSQPVAATSSVTSSIPAEPTADEKLTAIEPLLAANVASDCQTALATIDAVLAGDASNERAKSLQAKANTCITPPKSGPQPGAASPDKPAIAIAPAQGGLELLQGETEKAYKVRIAAMNKKYDDAVALLASQRYVQAMAALNEIVSDVPSGYRELQQRRDEARGAIRAEAKSLLDAAQTADSRDNYDAALDGYRRAHQLDQSIQVDALIQRVVDRKVTAGKTKCNAGKVAFAFGDSTTATAAFQEAVRLMQGTPAASDPCYTTAREYLQKAGK
jgi:hypothetical protein